MAACRRGHSSLMASSTGARLGPNLTPPPDPLLSDLHRYYSAKGKREELIARFQQRVEDRPDAPEGYEDLGQLYRLDGQTGKALETYGKLVEKNPRSLSGKLGLASLSVDRGEYTKAIELYENLRRTNPELAPQIDSWLRTQRQRANP